MYYASLIVIILTAIYDIIVKIADFKKEETDTLSKKIKKGAHVFFPIILMGLALFIFISETFDQDQKLETAEKNIVNLKNNIDSLRESVKDSVISLKDSLIKNIRETSNENISSTNTALAKYKVLYDTSLKAIVPIINSKSINRPTIYIPSISNNNDNYPLYTQLSPDIFALENIFYSEGNVSYNVKFNVKIFAYNQIEEEGSLAIFDIELIDSVINTHVARNIIQKASFTLQYKIKKRLYKYPKIIYYIYGTYSDNDNTYDKYDFGIAYLYNLEKKETIKEIVDKKTLKSFDNPQK